MKRLQIPTNPITEMFFETDLCSVTEIRILCNHMIVHKLTGVVDWFEHVHWKFPLVQLISRCEKPFISKLTHSHMFCKRTLDPFPCSPSSAPRCQSYALVGKCKTRNALWKDSPTTITFLHLQSCRTFTSLTKSTTLKNASESMCQNGIGEWSGRLKKHPSSFGPGSRLKPSTEKRSKWIFT